MSVRANLEVDTTGLGSGTGTSLVIVQGAKAGSNVAGGSFQDSWQAQVATDGADALVANAAAEKDNSMPADAPNCANNIFRLLQAIAGHTESADADPGTSEKSGFTSLRVRGHQPAAAIGSSADKKPRCKQLASDAASQLTSSSEVAAASNNVAAPLQQLPNAIANRNELRSDISTASFAGSKNRSTAASSLVEGSFLATRSTAATTDAATAGAAAADGNAGERPISSGSSDSTGTFRVADAHDMESGDKLQSSLVSPEGNRRLAPRESPFDSNLPVDPAAAAVEDKGAKLEERVRLGDEQADASMQHPPLPGTQQQAQDANGSGIKNVPAESQEAASLKTDRGTALSTEPVQLSGGAATISESTRASKSRATLIASGTQSLKRAAPSSYDAFTPHTVGVQGNSETVRTGAVAPKTGVSTSVNARLEETFNALESGTKIDTGESGSARSGRIQAEAGYQDPALGWVSVRAESSRGMVHATVLSQSADAAQVLSGHMADLHTYLAENRTPVETLTLASFGGSGQHLGGQDAERGMHQGAEQHAGHDNSEPVLSTQSTVGVFAEGSNEVFARADADRAFDGRHISVVV